MNGQNLVDETNTFLDDEIDTDTLLALVNFLKNLIEAAREWIFLQTEDTSITFSSSDDYKTAKDLPDDFVYDLKVELGVEADDDYVEYFPCQLKDRRMYRDSQRYCIDWKNFKIYICGSVNSTKTVFLNYIYQTDDITTSTSPVWPARFHKILSFLAAAVHQADIDVDDLTLRQALGLSKDGKALYESMKDWDAKMRLRAMNHHTGFHRTSAGPITDKIDLTDF